MVTLARTTKAGGVSYRPGARFGPAAVRNGSKLLRPCHPGLETTPLTSHQVADAGDIAANPFDIAEAIAHIDRAARALLDQAGHLIAIGGDHTYTHGTPFRRAVEEGLLAMDHRRCRQVRRRPGDRRRSATGSATARST